MPSPRAGMCLPGAGRLTVKTDEEFDQLIADAPRLTAEDGIIPRTALVEQYEKADPTLRTRAREEPLPALRRHLPSSRRTAHLLARQAQPDSPPVASHDDSVPQPITYCGAERRESTRRTNFDCLPELGAAALAPYHRGRRTGER